MLEVAENPPGVTVEKGSAGLVRLSDGAFNSFRGLIAEVAGIHMNDSKKRLVESRLAKRLRRFEYRSYDDYYDHLRMRDPHKEELREMINCITTNKTSFFRESHHFDFLREQIFGPGSEAINIWSAGCSTGPEPYSIALTGAVLPDLAGRLKIVASDIDTTVLDKAQRGVYSEEEIGPLNQQQRRFFRRGKSGSEGLVKASLQLRDMITFRQINLNSRDWQHDVRYDVIFCRNVIIYFNRETQEQLLRRFAQHLKPGGYLVLGHSESIQWFNQLFAPCGHTVYRLAAAPLSAAPSSHNRPVRSSPKKRPMKRIEAGDVHASDSPTEIRTLLGSCVAVCLHDPVAGLGGMNHFMLPASRADHGESARYGVHAMELLINKMMHMGGERERFRAKVFGGASVLRMGGAAPRVAEMNAAFITKFLKDEHIPLDGQSLGGQRPLEVRMQTDTGKVRVKALDSGMMRNVVEDEVRRTREVVQKDVEVRKSEVTLF